MTATRRPSAAISRIFAATKRWTRRSKWPAINKAKAKNVGRGLAFSEWSPSGGEGNVFVTIEEDGKVKIISPVVDQGAGVLTVIVEVVGEELQVPADEIELKQVDSTIVPSDGGVGGSRATRVYGNASYEARHESARRAIPLCGAGAGGRSKELSTDRGEILAQAIQAQDEFRRGDQVQRRADLCARLL